MRERVVVMTERRRGVGYGTPTDGAPAPPDTHTSARSPPGQLQRLQDRLHRVTAHVYQNYLNDQTQGFVTQPITSSRTVPLSERRRAKTNDCFVPMWLVWRDSRRSSAAWIWRGRPNAPDHLLVRLELPMSDVRTACRALWKTPGFSLVAIFTIAVGIGANTALFSVYDRLVLNPVTIPESFVARRDLDQQPAARTSTRRRSRGRATRRFASTRARSRPSASRRSTISR